LTIALFLASAAVGVFASETGRRPLLIVFKPLTTILLFAVVGWPRTPFAWWIDTGIAFSLAGDVALLSASKSAFLVGLALFLVAHGAYTVAFIGAAPATSMASSVPVLCAGVVMAVVTALLLRKLWPGAVGLRGPLVAYAVALAVMVVSSIAAAGLGVGVAGTGAGAATSVVATSVSPAVALGAALFYASDASLAIDRFARPIAHAPLFTLGLYWLGQLGIALAARTVPTG
jgi:uncharacterized membrane protein YhhN